MSYQLGLQNHGTCLLIKISADSPAEVEDAERLFHNHGASNGEMTWLDDYSAYFWATKAKFMKALESISFHRILNTDPSKFKGLKGGIQPMAKEIAEKWYEAIPRVSLMNFQGDTHEFGIDPQAEMVCNVF